MKKVFIWIGYMGVCLNREIIFVTDILVRGENVGKRARMEIRAEDRNDFRGIISMNPSWNKLLGKNLLMFTHLLNIQALP